MVVLLLDIIVLLDYSLHYIYAANIKDREWEKNEIKGSFLGQQLIGKIKFQITLCIIMYNHQ